MVLSALFIAAASAASLAGGTGAPAARLRSEVVHAFEVNSSASGWKPQSDLLLGSDGALYGTTSEGGTGGGGTLFRFDPATRVLETLHHFDGTLGRRPLAAVIDGGDGALYGTASEGGALNNGTIFRYDMQTGSTAAVHHFAGGSEGATPSAPLLRATDGFLYGTTYGIQLGGTVFRFEPATGTLTTLVSFFPSGSPEGGLTEASDGMLYGTVLNVSLPYLFRWDRTSSSLTVVKRFLGLSLPSSAVTESNGAIYAAAAHQAQHGDIFRYDLATGAWTICFDFSGPNGDTPMSTLARGPDGLLYGTTRSGGAYGPPGGYGLGTVYRFDPVTFAQSVVLHFDGSNGAHPLAGVVFMPDGTMYGTASYGGPKGGGVIFRLVRWR